MTTPVNQKPTYAVEERVASASEPSGTMPSGSPGLETALVRVSQLAMRRKGLGAGEV